jgi:hypothetical protein
MNGGLCPRENVLSDASTRSGTMGLFPEILPFWLIRIKHTRRLADRVIPLSASVSRQVDCDAWPLLRRPQPMRALKTKHNQFCVLAERSHLEILQRTGRHRDAGRQDRELRPLASPLLSEFQSGRPHPGGRTARSVPDTPMSMRSVCTLPVGTTRA